MLAYVLAAFMVALQILDARSTYLSLKTGDREANPLLRSLFAKVGVVPTLAVVKAVAIVAVGYLAVAAQHYFPALGILTALVVVYGIAVANNFRNAEQ